MLCLARLSAATSNTILSLYVLVPVQYYNPIQQSLLEYNQTISHVRR